MNKRIRQLAEQAGIPAIDGEWDYNDRNLLVKDGGEWRAAVPSEIISAMIQSEKVLEKFVELIVQECAERLLNDAKLTDIQTTRCVASIREHFGVE